MAVILALRFFFFFLFLSSPPEDTAATPHIHTHTHTPTKNPANMDQRKHIENTCFLFPSCHRITAMPGDSARKPAPADYSHLCSSGRQAGAGASPFFFFLPIISPPPPSSLEPSSPPPSPRPCPNLSATPSIPTIFCQALRACPPARPNVRRPSE